MSIGPLSAAGVFAAVGLTTAATVRGQQPDPLGNSHYLDNNLSLNTRINSERRGWVLNRINEAIVTGTIGGGKEFRGNLGYTAPNEFRGATAGNLLYNFNRDSIFSGLQYQRRLPTRYQPGGGLAQLPSQPGRPGGDLGVQVMRPTTTLDLRTIAKSRYGTRQEPYDAGSTLRSLRNSFSSRPGGLDNSLNNVFIAGQSLKDLSAAVGPAAVTSEPLLDRTNMLTTAIRSRLDWSRSDRRQGSVDLTQPTIPSATPGNVPGTPDLMPRNPLAGPLTQSIDGVSFMQGWSDRVQPSTVRAQKAGAAPVLVGQDAYTDYLAQLAAPSAPTKLPGPGEAYTDDLIRSMRQLAGVERDGASTAGDTGQVLPILPGVEGENDEAEPGPVPLISPQLLEAIKGQSPIVMDLSGENASRFSDQMKKAQGAMTEGRYFDADRWFDVALAFSPDHPFAIAGKIHAELGAGMFRSAALNIRRLFTNNPELINTRYDAKLLPSDDRLNERANELDDLLLEGGSAIETGLVLAYTGHLLDRADLIRRGLDDLEARQPDDPLCAALVSVWLAED